jgi:hypothetical protein
MSGQQAFSMVEPEPIRLALKIVDFLGEDQSPSLGESRITKLVGEVNQIYSKCQLSFQMEKYSPVDPKAFGLNFHLSSVDRLFEVRRPFHDPQYIVVINTGSWDHKKMGSPNAWTAMPGEIPAGVVIESPVATFAGIVAHEIGHYLSLHHLGDQSNLMNPIIYRSSQGLTPTQCQEMRKTAISIRSKAIRNSPKTATVQLVGGKPKASFTAEYSG